MMHLYKSHAKQSANFCKAQKTDLIFKFPMLPDAFPLCAGEVKSSFTFFDELGKIRQLLENPIYRL